MGINSSIVRTDRIQINAPIDFVWDILTDVEKYGEWNPFTPRARTDFKIGSPARLLVRMGPTKFRITERVCAFEKPRLIAWCREFGTSWLLFVVREQHLEPISDTSCSYHNVDLLSGVLSSIVSLFFGGYMRRGFGDVGVGLKLRAETLYRDTENRISP